ncbi:glutamine--tRNA ligase [Longibacter salinarum]|uniref:Glutamine--tRNA ligase n=1 Tax=Longibacter salinarum TaxID=1850348 RepID=A0A2A8D2E4_9BACT|nr:glutamine--tRNA ligase/YqeY domain fusion protein [Longibacter salinarum]PEN15119.1 glutamine--tRNA ligase [Longibacter salinarum]
MFSHPFPPTVPPAVTDSNAPSSEHSNFIRDIIDEDLKTGRHGDRVATRFPPEPNGYLHIGHAKSIVLNFGIKQDYADRADTQCHLRFDDTNPETESMEYVESIKDAVRWLGYDWDDHLYHASDYFEQFYDFAVVLIEKGLAYVDSLDETEIRKYRGTVNKPGRPSPYRDRSVEENLDLFRRMRDGEFENGEHVLRAKIDMASPHMIMRDPLLFRIKHAHHYRRGDEWCIYPMYDFAHPLEDAIENITHSLCTLEFDNNRRVYDWVLENCLEPDKVDDRPHQHEFARLNITYTVMSKRKLLQLVEEGRVNGWDDPRLPTIFGMRRRGITPDAIVSFCEDVGVTRSESRVEIAQFEHAIRDDLNEKAPRVMAVLDPLKVVITNVDDTLEPLEANHWPRDIDRDEMRSVPFSNEIYIERDDFREDPPSDFIRLAPGREVRLRSGYFFTCEDVIHNENGDITEIRGTIDPETRDGTAPDGRSPRGTIHWVSARHAVPFEARLYDRLFDVPAPDDGEEDFHAHLNDDSLIVKKGFVEPSVRDFDADQRFQFERNGYFWQDPEDSSDEALVFNQIVPLRDTWTEDEDTVDLEKKRREKEEQKRRNRERSIANKKDPAETLDDDARALFLTYRDEYGVSPEDAAIIAGRDDLAALFTDVVNRGSKPQLAANWIVNELLGLTKGAVVTDLPFDASDFASLLDLIANDQVSSSGGRTVLEILVDRGGAPEAIVDREGLRQIDDTEKLRLVVQSVVDDHPDEADRYRNGKKGLVGFFMGQVMQRTKGSANPEKARELVQEELGD